MEDILGAFLVVVEDILDFGVALGFEEGNLDFVVDRLVVVVGVVGKLAAVVVEVVGKLAAVAVESCMGCILLGRVGIGIVDNRIEVVDNQEDTTIVSNEE